MTCYKIGLLQTFSRLKLITSFPLLVKFQRFLLPFFLTGGICKGFANNVDTRNFEPVTKVKIGHRIEFERKQPPNFPPLLELIAAHCGPDRKMSPTSKWNRGFPSRSLAFPCQTSSQCKFLFRNGSDPLLLSGQLNETDPPMETFFFETLKGDKQNILVEYHQAARSDSREKYSRNVRGHF